MSRQAKLAKNVLTGIEAAAHAIGSQAALAEKLGISRQAISQWRVIPAGWLLKVESVTGVPRERLRPDLYR